MRPSPLSQGQGLGMGLQWNLYIKDALLPAIFVLNI